MIVRICEEEGFIPRYYTETPQDKVDQTLLDIQHYTRTLVMDELNLGNMIESALIQIEKDKEKEAKIDIGEGEDEDEEAAKDKELFSYRDEAPITDNEYAELLDSEEKRKQEDHNYLNGGDI